MIVYDMRSQWYNDRTFKQLRFNFAVILLCSYSVLLLDNKEKSKNVQG